MTNDHLLQNTSPVILSGATHQSEGQERLRGCVWCVINTHSTVALTHSRTLPLLCVSEEQSLIPCMQPANSNLQELSLGNNTDQCFIKLTSQFF